MALGAQTQPTTTTGTATAEQKRDALVASLRQEHAAVASLNHEDQAAKARQARRLAHIADCLALHGAPMAAAKAKAKAEK